MSDGSRASGGVECFTYTHARRFPMILGKIGGWTMPIQLSMAQLAVLGAGYFVGFVTRPVWGHFGAWNGVLLAAGPWPAVWAVRHLRREGRDALRWLMGLGSYWASPRRGVRYGRPARAPRPQQVTARVWVTSSDEAT